MIHYLHKDLGFTAKASAKLWDRFGEDIFQTLADDPGSVHDCIRVKKEKLEAISERVKKELAEVAIKVALSTVIAGTAIPKTVIHLAVEKWGPLAPEVVARDPFKLMAFPRVGFDSADSLYSKLGLPNAKLKRRAYAVLAAIADVRDNRCWFVESELTEAMTLKVGPLGSKKQIELLVRSKRLAIHRDADQQMFYSPAETAKAEAGVASRITKLLSNGKPDPLEGF